MPFLSPRCEKSLQELGILPKLEGFYRFDDKIAEVDAVFLSHAHMDHSAYVSFVNREIPVYCGEATKIILQTLGEMRAAGLEFNVDDILFESFRKGDVITVDGLEIERVRPFMFIILFQEPTVSLFTLLMELSFILEISGLTERSLR